MDILQYVNWSQLFSLEIVFSLVLGSVVGMFIGALPGLGAAIAITMVLPLTYTMHPLSALIMLLSVYQSAEYGGSISSVVLGVPGTPAAVATVLDGNTMARQGNPGKALAYSLHSSAVGGIFGGLALVFFTLPIAKVAANLADPEYFLIAFLGLIMAASINSKSLVKSLVSVCIGLLLACIGPDPFTGDYRFTFGLTGLNDGIALLSLLIGVFAIAEMLKLIAESLHETYVKKYDSKALNTGLTWKEFKAVFGSTIMGSLIGALLGGIPGFGPSGATYLAYGVQSNIKSFSKKDPYRDIKYGEGNPHGIAAPEAANNSGVGTNLIPVLALGIPNTATIAIVMGALIVHGIKTGPKLIAEQPELVAGLLVGFMFTSVIMYVVGRFMTSAFTRCLLVPNNVLVPMVVIISLMGAYAEVKTIFSVFMAILFGVVGYFMIKLDFNVAATVLAFVLGGLLEDYYRRSILISRNGILIFWDRPICRGILLVVVIGWACFMAVKLYEKKKHAAAK